MARCSHEKEKQQEHRRFTFTLMKQIDQKNAELFNVNTQLEEKDKQLKEGNEIQKNEMIIDLLFLIVLQIKKPQGVHIML